MRDSTDPSQIYSSPCFNPAHRHPNPYDGLNWYRQLGHRVRAALDKVDRDCALLTETCTDVVNESCDATLILWGNGKELAPMRLAVPNYRGVAHHHVGEVECALNGWICGPKQAANDRYAWSNGYHDVLIGPGLEKRPPGYHSEPESDRKLLWHQLSASFPEAAIYGDPTDVDPTPQTDEDLESEPDGIYVTIHSGFAAVLLPLPGCPALVQLKEVPTLQGGQPVTLEVDLVAPWCKNVKPQSLIVEAPGLEVLSPRPTVPGRLTIQAPRSADPGDYPLRISGRCLPLKRWFHKTDAAAAEAAATRH